MSKRGKPLKYPWSELLSGPGAGVSVNVASRTQARRAQLAAHGYARYHGFAVWTEQVVIDGKLHLDVVRTS